MRERDVLFALPLLAAPILFFAAPFAVAYAMLKGDPPAGRFSRILDRWAHTVAKEFLFLSVIGIVLLGVSGARIFAPEVIFVGVPLLALAWWQRESVRRWFFAPLALPSTITALGVAGLIVATVWALGSAYDRSVAPRIPSRVRSEREIAGHYGGGSVRLTLDSAGDFSLTAQNIHLEGNWTTRPWDERTDAQFVRYFPGTERPRVIEFRPFLNAAGSREGIVRLPLMECLNEVCLQRTHDQGLYERIE